MIKDKISGFTLIELLVVVAIVMLLSGIGLASYHNFSEKEMVEGAVSEAKTEIKLAASRALNNEKSSVCGDETLTGWYVDFSNKQIYGECGATIFGTKEFVNFTNFNIATNPSLASGLLRFKPLSGGIDIDGDGILVTVSFIADNTKEGSFYIDKSGAILASDPH